MPSRLKKVHKVSADDTAVSKEIFIRYFSSLGLHSERDLEYHSPAWHSAFRVKFGKSEFRRQAWAQVRAAMRGLLPAEVFVRLDTYFSDGESLHFTTGFTTDEKFAMQAAITKQRAALLKQPNDLGQTIDRPE